MTNPHTPNGWRMGYRNGVLTVIAALLGLIALENMRPPAARAEASIADPPPRSTGLISAAQQRKNILHELRKLTAAVEDVNETLHKEISVKVTQMPRTDGPAEGEG